MESLPKRTSLVSETANTLKIWINDGILSGLLPGEMQLKQRLGVGRDTLRLALKLLERGGWTTPTSKGRQRRVQIGRRPTHKLAGTPRFPVTFLSPDRLVDRQVLLEMEDLQKRLAEQGRELRFLSPHIFHLKNPGSQLERLTQEHRSAAWILYLTGEAVQRWFEQQKIPAFIYGSPFPGVNLPFTVNDWEAGSFHAGIQLLRRRHRVIGILEDQGSLAGSLTVERGLRRALATIGARGRLEIIRDERSPVAVARAFEQIFSMADRPTALMLTNSAQLLTGFSWLAARGWRTPADISLVSIAHDSCFSEFYPPAAYYRSNCKIMARHIRQRVMELVDTGQVSRNSIRVHLEYVPGATIGPPPRRGAAQPVLFPNK